MKNLTLEETLSVSGGVPMMMSPLPYASHLVERMEKGAMLGYMGYLLDPQLTFRSAITKGMMMGYAFWMLEYTALLIDTRMMVYIPSVKQHSQTDQPIS